MCDCKPPTSPSRFPIPKSFKPEPAPRGLGVEVVSSDDEAWSGGLCLYQAPEKTNMIARIISSCFAEDFWILLRVLPLCILEETEFRDGPPEWIALMQQIPREWAKGIAKHELSVAANPKLVSCKSVLELRAECPKLGDGHGFL